MLCMCDVMFWKIDALTDEEQSQWQSYETMVCLSVLLLLRVMIFPVNDFDYAVGEINII